MEGYVKEALRKELLIDPFVEHFKTTTLGMSQRQHLSILRTKMTKHCIFAKFLLVEG